MSFAKIYSAQNHLLKAHLISIEIDISRGLHHFSIVGLPDKAIEESRDRVCSAIKNSGFKSPKQTNTKIVVSLAPADIRKEGPAFDLPIALGYLMATGNIKNISDKSLFVGELTLDGNVRPVSNTLMYAYMAYKNGFKEIFVPSDNAKETSYIKNIKVFGVNNLNQIIKHLNDTEYIPETKINLYDLMSKDNESEIDFDDIVGQETAKRGLIVSASGGHNIGLYGPPGTGKTMLAKAMQSIMPALLPEEVLEVTEIYSMAGISNGSLISKPPVRSPHHKSSYSSIIGGGNSTPKPGEATLAHKGILFMDEFTEFSRDVLEALRQPLEEKKISVSRSGSSFTFPTDFILIASMNLCHCGNRGVSGKVCICTASDIARFNRKLSGPIIDRIDMWLEVSKIDYEKLINKKDNNKRLETKKAMDIVIRTRKIQKERFKNTKTYLNSQINVRYLSETMNISQPAKDVLEKFAKNHSLSGRGFHKTIKLARTIADIESSEKIETQHILEALQYRQRI